MKEKTLLRDYGFRKYLKAVGINRRIFKDMDYKVKANIVSAFYGGKKYV